MSVWAVIYLMLLVLSLGLHLAKHGEPKDGTYSFWSALISVGIQVFILYKAGIFS